LLEEIVEILNPCEEIMRHVCGAKYSIMNLIYSYICMLKNRYAPVAMNSKFIEDWIALIHDDSEDSNNESDISSIFTPTNCDGLLEKISATIYLSFDELWDIPSEIGLKEERQASFPLLYQLARKYLSIFAISVLSEYLFSNTEAYISARRTRLAPDLVRKMLFLKRNSNNFLILLLLEDK
ncbi:9089_t:CDS:2, partial [Scutellospora calospora]